MMDKEEVGFLFSVGERGAENQQELISGSHRHWLRTHVRVDFQEERVPEISDELSKMGVLKHSLESIKHSSDVGMICLWIVSFFWLHTKRDILGEMLKEGQVAGPWINPDLPNLALVHECQQLTDASGFLPCLIRQASCHVWSCSPSPAASPCAGPSSSLLNRTHKAFRLCPKEPCLLHSLLGGRNGSSPERCSWQGSLCLPATPTASLDIPGNRILNYLWFSLLHVA